VTGERIFLSVGLIRFRNPGRLLMSNDDERVKSVKTKALKYDQNHHGCGQSVLAAVQEEFGIGNRESLKALSCMAGGVAEQGETCGAIIGALAALNLVNGREDIRDIDTFRSAMLSSRELYSRFKEELRKQYGLDSELADTTCRHIQERLYGRGFDMSDEKEREAFDAAGGHSDNGCPKVCGIAAEVVAQQLLKIVD
jgi:C_GCAxxG_C_C family probable redox protein